MKPTSRTRKPAGDLHKEDLATFPVWTYVMDESKYDETYVKPLTQQSIPEGDVLHVAATFTTAYGGVFEGLVEVATLEASPAYQFPTLFGSDGLFGLRPPGGPIMCPPDAVPLMAGAFERDYNQYLGGIERFFGRPAAEVFPIRWKAHAPHEGTERYPAGEVPYPPAIGYELQVFEIPDWVKAAVKGAGDA